MRKLSWLVLFLIHASYGLSGIEALAQEKDDSGSQAQQLQRLQLQSNQVPSSQTARYLITYMNSDAVSRDTHAATVATVTNLAGTSCDVSVNWFRGFRTRPICTTRFKALANNNTADFCSRRLPIAITQCNATCSPKIAFDEGSAVVGSSAAPASCARIGVSARVYYTGERSDTAVQAITDSKVVKLPGPNRGD